MIIDLAFGGINDRSDESLYVLRSQTLTCVNPKPVFDTHVHKLVTLVSRLSLERKYCVHVTVEDEVNEVYVNNHFFEMGIQKIIETLTGLGTKDFKVRLEDPEAWMFSTDHIDVGGISNDLISRIGARLQALKGDIHHPVWKYVGDFLMWLKNNQDRSFTLGVDLFTAEEYESLMYQNSQT